MASPFPKKIRKVAIVFLFFGLCFIQYRIITDYRQGNTNIFSQVIHLVQNQDNENTASTVNLNKLYRLLDDLDVTIRKKAPENKIYGNIYSAKGRQQVESYISAITEFELQAYPIKTICEIGFAGGHSATVFLFSTKSANYVAFDMWDQPVYENAAFSWVQNQFQNRSIRLIKGDSTKTVPQFKGKCDLIHIDGAHHANYPITDMKNMARLASPYNLLLMDDCTKSWPAVLKGVDYLKNNGLVSYLEMFVAEGWVFRNSQKGWCIGSYNKPVPSFTFLGKQFCEPSWSGPNCEKQLEKPCSKLSDECFYNSETGVLSVSCERWRGAQKTEKVTWDTRNTATDRNEAHAKSFDSYKSLPNDLGDLIELGAGPFTQSQTILSNHVAKSVTLIEPMAFHYIKNVKHCFYKNGTFKGLPTTILSIPAEELKNSRKFDTLVMINVIEHVYDAISILNSAVNLIKDGGLFIWHERIWDDYRGVAKSSDDREFQLHPIRIKSVIAQQLMSIFDTLYVSWNTEELRRLKNQGVYFIGRKRINTAITTIPLHPYCVPRPPGVQTVVFFVSNHNYTIVESYSKTIKDSSNVKSVILISTEALNPEVVNTLVTFPKVIGLLSHHFIHHWYQELSFYTTPCSTIVQSLTQDMFKSSNTVCVGNVVDVAVTVILMGYSVQRLPNYNSILSAYTNMETMKKVIMIWNNLKEPFPSKYAHPKLTFIYPETNSMNNRISVSQSLIETEAVLLIDDDVLLNELLLISMLRKWTENKERLIGVSPDMRYITKNNEYAVQGSNPVITIGKTMLFHKKYLEQYMADNELVEWNRERFCEDISMNGIIFKATGLKPFFVPQTKMEYRKNLPEKDGVSLTKKNWGGKRTDCLRYTMKHFNITFV